MKAFSGTLLISALLISLLFQQCVSTEITDGDTAWRLKKYELASRLLTEDFYKENDPMLKPEIAFKVAESFRYINDTESAEEWYKRAISSGYEGEAGYLYAKMLQANLNYKEAIAQYRILINDEPWRRAEFNREIDICNNALQWLQEANYTRVENLDMINSTGSDFSPALFENNALVFASNRSAVEGEEKDLWTGQKFYDLLIATTESEGKYSDPQPFSSAINTPFNEGPAIFSSDYTTLYFTRCGADDKTKNDFCDIYTSTRLEEGGWSLPVKLDLFEDSLNTGHPALTPDGKTLVFTVTDPNGFGGSDLYYVKRSFEGWSFPTNLGPAINTPGDEAFPYIDSEGNLYYSSNGLPGLGGFDIFKATGENNKWKAPEALPYPVNSNGDDFGVIIEPLTIEEQETLKMKGIITSSRSGGKGNDDIYRFYIEKPPARYELTVFVKEKLLADPFDPNSEVLSLHPLDSSFVDFFEQVPNGENLLQSSITDTSGKLFFELKENMDYRLFASHDPGYFSKSAYSTTKGKTAKPGEVRSLELEIVLDKIFESVEIEIPNIYYDFNESFIREDAAAVLDTSILVLMLENPTIIVELGSHTDSRGTRKSNQQLSENRAKAVVDYLAAKGIAPERMKAKGYGESQLVNDCRDGVECDEEEHQRNRRTTFKVLSARFKVESFEPENIIVDPKED